MKKHLYPLLSLLFVFIFGLSIFNTGNRVVPVAAASGGKIYIDPASASSTVNGTFSVRVRVSSPSPINAAFVNIYYNGRGLQFLSAQRGSGFPNQNSPTQHTPGNEGVIKMQSTRNNSQAGDFHFATINFKATAAGTWGVRPGTDSSIINYPSNTVSFTVGRADYTVNNPTPPVVNPPTTPTTPTPTPNPTPRPTSPSSGRTTTPAAQAPTASNVSDSGMQITNLTVTEQDYRSVRINWNTSKPSTSKVNYSTNSDDLFSESLTEVATTTHSIKIEGDTLRAGKHYYARITADDGSGPTTLDTEFDTKSIPVIIKATDSEDKPLTGALVQVGDTEGTTDENGEVTLNLPEGDVIIFAQKDELSKELSETIEIPSDENTQRITLALSKTAVVNKVTTPSKKSTPWLLYILPAVFIILLVAFLLWRRRNQKSSQAAYYGDPLEAENYSQQVIPSTPDSQLPPANPEIPEPLPLKPVTPLATAPEPEYLPLSGPSLPHHSSLPELVGRYGTENATDTKPEIHTLPEVNSSVSATGQEIPKHSSLKDLVKVPTDETVQTDEPNLDIVDLPSSPRDAATQNSNTSHSYDPRKHSDGSLTIEH